MGCELISNVCRHRQAVMLKGRGSCRQQSPAARAATWCARCTAGPTAAAPSGRPLAGRAPFCQDPCLNLDNYPLQQWNGLLFEANGATWRPTWRAWARCADLDFTGHVLDHVELHECNYNWKTFIEVYLEDYHVGPFHPGLGSFVTCEDLRWEFKQHYSVQTVGVANRLGKAGSPVYERWQKACWTTARPAARNTAPSG
jgi:choline monooxygenase